jgi:hypothetical protein
MFAFMTRARSSLVAAAVALSAVTAAGAASADDTIKQPGDHPHYAVEAEPHLLLGWGGGWGGNGLGIGGRFTIPIVDNGFVSTINNSVGIGFGLDVLFFNACYYNGPGCSAVGYDFPVVMQWNFYVAQRWSVFGEPGLVIYHDQWNCNGGACPGGGPSDTFLEPAIYVGGRYHINDTVALTMRIGFPTFSFGGSFFL